MKHIIAVLEDPKTVRLGAGQYELDGELYEFTGDQMLVAIVYFMTKIEESWYKPWNTLR